ncbi:MAG TPA: TlpA disulfide reductase family protein [Candidatus Sulfopaludibacter sp.]|nr:TlpA disulfide reductase family protein [Candidatus Sulfopaludibacter sp.]
MPALRSAGLRVCLLALAALSPGAQQLPRKAGDWAIQTVDGRQIQMSSYRGKVVLLAFILTTCPHCQKTIGILSGLEPKYGPMGVQFLASAAEGNAKAAVPGFVLNFHVPFPVGYNDDVQKLLAFWQYPATQVPLMPVIMLIDRQGAIRFQHDGHDTDFFNDQEKRFPAEMDELLRMPARKAAK